MIQWIDRLNRHAVFWDIGANVGVFSLYAAVMTNCTVVAFEPTAANFSVLARNIHLNGLNDRVAAYCVALSGATELGVLNLASFAMGTSMTQFGRAGEMSRYWAGGFERGEHGMVGFTVDEFIARFNPPFPTHIKIDVDGLESRILQGATKTLRNRRVHAAMIELSLTNDAERERAVALLEEAGLKYVSRGDWQGDTTERAANHLFERSTF